MSTGKKKIEDLTKPEFKKMVQEYFDKAATLNAARKVESGVYLPITLPGLAKHLGWTTEKLLYYPEDGKFSDIVDYAKVNCESFLLEAIFSKQIDKGVGIMMLKNYFSYSDSQSDEARKEKRRRSISKVLDEIEMKD